MLLSVNNQADWYCSRYITKASGDFRRNCWCKNSGLEVFTMRGLITVTNSTGTTYRPRLISHCLNCLTGFSAWTLLLKMLHIIHLLPFPITVCCLAYKCKDTDGSWVRAVIHLHHPLNFLAKMILIISLPYLCPRIPLPFVVREWRCKK